jgi:ubiquinone/menaquinone biosynthesis C-methylase UbiE
LERSALNSKFYDSDEERWNEINKVRSKIAEHLQIPQGSLVLDVLVGEGDFARTVAKCSRDTHVIAGEILASDLKEAKRRVERDALKERIELLMTDVTRMPFKENTFEYVANFLGWEDFAAISGEEKIDDAFKEMARVLKTHGILAIAFIPLLEFNDAVSRKDIELQEYMYKSVKRPRFFHEEFFLQMFENHGLSFLRKDVFETQKNRLRPKDAKRFLKWNYDNYRSFYAPDVEMRPYEETLGKFREFIDKYGIRENKSKFVLLVGKKSGRAKRNLMSHVSVNTSNEG